MRKIVLGLLIVIIAGLLLTGAFSGGVLIGHFATRQSAPRSDLLDYELLNQVLTLLNNKYYGEIPDESTLTYGAISGLLLTLDDPYTAFLEPKVARIMREDATGQFEGIGVTVEQHENGYLEIIRVFPNQPAAQAGLLSGDLIISADGTDLTGLGLYDAINLVRGPRDTQVRLEILRQGEGLVDPLVFTITRARIEMPIVEYELLEGDIAYLRLTEFDATATTRMKAALESLLNEMPAGLILDLRDNPGGYLHEAFGVADLFLDKGIVLIQRDSAGREQIWRSTDGEAGEYIPLVVLVNNASASASELVAGALQDRGRAVLIGEQTFGKGSVQQPHDFRDGSQLRVTTARWFTPNEQSIHGDGITPNIEVPHPADALPGEDPQLQRAIEYLKENF